MSGNEMVEGKEVEVRRGKEGGEGYVYIRVM